MRYAQAKPPQTTTPATVTGLTPIYWRIPQCQPQCTHP